MVNPGSFPGARGEFIRAQTELYAESVKDSHVADTLADIQRRFFKRFSVALGDSEEPSQEWLAQVDDDAPDDELRFPNIEGMDKNAADAAVAVYTDLVARTKFKKDQIKRRLHYIYTKNKDAESDFDKAARDPIASITSKLLGIELKLPRKKTAYNVWGPKHRAEVDPVFSKRVEELGARKEQHAAIRSAVYKELFENLPMDTQKKWSTISEREHEQAVSDVKKRFKNSLSFSPEDRQRVIAALPKFIEPILDAIAEYTGWKASFIAGGPEPADGGRLNMISNSIHSGLTLGPVKMDFGRAQKSAYKSHIAPAFGAFLKKSYSVHDCRASALPKDHSSISIGDVAGDEEVAMQVHTFESDAEHEKMHKPKRLFEDIAKSGKSTKPSQPPTGTPSPRVRFVPPIGKTKTRVLPVKDSALVKLGPSPLSQSFVIAGTDATSSSDLPAASSSTSTTSSTTNGPRAATSASSNWPVTAINVVESFNTHDDGKDSKVGGAPKDPSTPVHLDSAFTFDTATSAAKDLGCSPEPSTAAAALATPSATSNELSIAAAAPVASSATTTRTAKEPAAPDDLSVMLSGASNEFSTAVTAPAAPPATIASAVKDLSRTPATPEPSAAAAAPAMPSATSNELSIAAAAPVTSSATTTSTAKEPAAPDDLSVTLSGALNELSAPAASSATVTNAAKGPATPDDPSVMLSSSSNEPSTAAANPATPSATLKEASVAAASLAASSAAITSSVRESASTSAASSVPFAMLSDVSKEPSAAAAALAASSATNTNATKAPTSAPATPTSPSAATFTSAASTRLKPRANPAPLPPSSPHPSPPASLPPSPQGSPQRPTTPVRFSGAATVPDPSEIEATPAKGRKRKGAPAGKENTQERASKRLKTAAAVSLGKRKADAEGDVANKRQRTGSDQPFAVSVPEECPPWVYKALKLLTTRDLGPQWRSLLDAWLVFEQGHSFMEKKKPHLPPSGRPAGIGEWIKWARSPTHFPDIGSLDEFESAFNSWWRSLQPHWQACSGINGILSVLAGLFFWGYNASDATSLAAWDAAVANVLHALHELAKGA